MPSEAANRWWGETEKMEVGHWKCHIKQCLLFFIYFFLAVSFKNISLLVSQRRKSSPCVARGHTNRAGTPAVSPFFPPFPVKHHLLFLSSDNCPRGWAPQSRWWDTACRFRLEISLVWGGRRIWAHRTYIIASLPATTLVQLGVQPARARGSQRGVAKVFMVKGRCSSPPNTKQQGSFASCVACFNIFLRKATNPTWPGCSIIYQAPVLVPQKSSQNFS